jgi:hypothetical protein
MYRPILLSLLTCLACSSGCVIHDRSNAPEPFWWPSFVVRERSAQPSGHIEVHNAVPFFPPAGEAPPGAYNWKQ